MAEYGRIVNLPKRSAEIVTCPRSGRCNSGGGDGVRFLRRAVVPTLVVRKDAVVTDGQRLVGK